MRVDAGAGQVAVPDHPVGLAEEQVHPVHRVDAEVEDAAAGLRRVEQPVRLRAVEREPERGGDVLDRADLTGGDQVDRLSDQRVGPGPDRLHQEQAAVPGPFDQRLRPGLGDGDRLLDQHRLAGLQTQPGGVEVVTVDGRDVDHVDVGVGGQLGVGAVAAGEAVLRRELVGLLL
ncbi:MAG: hypothetical protein FWJ87_02375 [Micromonosporaceae bacterium]